MWRYPVILARLWIDNVNIFFRNVGTRMVRKTAESVLRNLDLMGQMPNLFSSVEFERQHLAAVPMFKTRQELFKFALDKVTVPDGLHAEFGVYKGDSVNRPVRLRPHKPFAEVHRFPRPARLRLHRLHSQWRPGRRAP